MRVIAALLSLPASRKTPSAWPTRFTTPIKASIGSGSSCAASCRAARPTRRACAGDAVKLKLVRGDAKREVTVVAAPMTPEQLERWKQNYELAKQEQQKRRSRQ
jgi:hypothetical protein